MGSVGVNLESEKNNPKSNVEAEHKPLEKGDCSGKINQIVHLCQGLNSHYFHIIGDGHQPNSRGLYTHNKDSLLKVGGFPSPKNATTLTMAHLEILAVKNFRCQERATVRSTRLPNKPCMLDLPPTRNKV